MIKILTILLVLCGGLSATEAAAENTLVYLNAQRAHFGLYPLLPSARLQQTAERGATLRAQRDMNGHWNGNRAMTPRWEGTAKRRAYQRGPAGEPWGKEDVYACYQNHKQARYAGCASVYNPRTRTWYYQINLDIRP